MSMENTFATRRGAILLAGAAALGVGGAGLWLARRRGLFARLFNPFSAAKFDLPAVAGLTDASGAAIPGFSAADIAGKAVYLNAFASWCPICREEHQALLDFARSGATIYGVASLDDPGETLAFLRDHGNPFARVGMDAQGYLLRALGARGVPAHFVFAPAPKLAFVAQGPMDLAELRANILPALS
jgi:cytochrome c biogenesis protein CcmG/thiol:disulfide interchange protein DsbE